MSLGKCQEEAEQAIIALYGRILEEEY